MYIFEVDLNTNKIDNLETLIPCLDRWKPLNGLFRLSTFSWPFAYHKEPRLSRTTNKSKPIKVKILKWDHKTQLLTMSLERYRTQGDGSKVWSDVTLSRSSFFAHRQAI